MNYRHILAVVFVALLVGACDHSSIEREEARSLEGEEFLTTEGLQAAKTAANSTSDIGALLHQFSERVAGPVALRSQRRGHSAIDKMLASRERLSAELAKGESANLRKVERLTAKLHRDLEKVISLNEQQLSAIIVNRILEIDPGFGDLSPYEVQAKYLGVGKEDCQHCDISYALKMVAIETAWGAGLIACAGSTFGFPLCAAGVTAVKATAITSVTYDLTVCKKECREEGA